MVCTVHRQTPHFPKHKFPITQHGTIDKHHVFQSINFQSHNMECSNIPELKSQEQIVVAKKVIHASMSAIRV